MKISVIGAGTFGTALANALKKENEISLYARNESVVNEINKSRRNKTCFPNKVLSKRIRATNKIEQAREADILFLCIPSYTVVDFIEKLNPNPNTLIVNGAKGFGISNKLIPEALRDIVSNRVASLKGPSFANEMIFELPTAFTIASNDESDYELIKKKVFREELIIFDFTKDIKGVEILSIIKNVYAIIIGIVDASFNSSNVRFLTFTKALNEMKQLLQVLNVSPNTIFSYSGIGDFGLTALNDLSRNRTLGLLIGKGFFNRHNVSNMIVLEGINAVDNLIGFIPPDYINKLSLLTNLNKLFKNRTDTKSFINEVIYN